MNMNKTIPFFFVRDLVWIESCVLQNGDKCSIFFLSLVHLIRFDWKFVQFLCFCNIWYVLVLVSSIGLIFSRLSRVNPTKSTRLSPSNQINPIGLTQPDIKYIKYIKIKKSNLSLGFVWMFLLKFRFKNMFGKTSFNFLGWFLF